ncbi:MAG: DedA family protein [Paludibacteraceae bacterium]|nr:DedA family protein [Paludibacteraceae bacterium]
MSFFIDYGLWGMFLSAFLAGTLVPVSSEVVLSALIALGLNKYELVTTAIVGNTLGGMTCYWVGYMGKTEWLEKYYKIDHEKIVRAKIWIDKYGVWAGLFSWVPILGNLIVVTLGYMKVGQWKAWLSVCIGKAFRYIVWMHLTTYSIEMLQMDF